MPLFSTALPDFFEGAVDGRPNSNDYIKAERGEGVDKNPWSKDASQKEMERHGRREQGFADRDDS